MAASRRKLATSLRASFLFSQTASRFDEELRRDYCRLKARRHSALAKVMVARKLAVRMYWMLRENKAYSPRPVARMQGSPGHPVVTA